MDTPLPGRAGARYLWIMWSFHLHPREGVVAVNVNRWPSQGPYPVVLFSFELIANEEESELGLIERAARAIEIEADRRRRAR